VGFGFNTQYWRSEMDADVQKSAVAKQRKTLEAAFKKYDTLVADGAPSLEIAVAEHEAYLASKALTMQMTDPGVYALGQLWQVLPPTSYSVHDGIDTQ
jgi:hypothetical protein